MTFRTIHGSAHDMADIPDKSVQLICTSPPYYSLRKYDGEQEIDWPELSYSPMPGLPPITVPAQRVALGLEPDPFAFIGHLILCLREWRRILRDDGLVFVNLGDSYSGSGKGRNADGTHQEGGKQGTNRGTIVGELYKTFVPSGLKPKDLMQIPQRFALAAQADGWYLRSAMPWIKRNGMPGSEEDRPTTTIESIFMLAKSEDYFYDYVAVEMPVASMQTGKAASFKRNGSKRGDVIVPGQGYGTHREEREENQIAADGKRRRRSSDWFFKSWQGLLMNEDGDPLAMVVNPKGFSAAHFAVWPENLVEPLILAGTSARGCCPACSAPWRRVVERTAMVIDRSSRRDQMGEFGRTQASGTMLEPAKSTTTGWEPTCACDAGEPQSCVVCDPFAGSNTTGKVAIKLGRRYIGVDLSEKYLGEITDARMGAGVQMELSW